MENVDRRCAMLVVERAREQASSPTEAPVSARLGHNDKARGLVRDIGLPPHKSPIRAMHRRPESVEARIRLTYRQHTLDPRSTI